MKPCEIMVVALERVGITEASELKPCAGELERELRKEEVHLIGCCVLEANP